MTISKEADLFKVESIHHIHGDQCLCGFKSAISRDRTKHIMEVTLEAAAPIIRAEALDAAARDAEGMHEPPAPDCQEWADWLRARAAAERGSGASTRCSPAEGTHSTPHIGCILR